MQLLDMSLRKTAVLTPGEYVKLFEEAPDSIDSVRMILPRIGKDDDFGSFKVFFTPDYYEAENV